MKWRSHQLKMHPLSKPQSAYRVGWSFLLLLLAACASGPAPVSDFSTHAAPNGKRLKELTNPGTVRYIGAAVRTAQLNRDATRATKIEFRLALPADVAGKYISVRLGSPTGKEIARLQTQSTGGWGNYQVQSTNIFGATAVTGEQTLYLVAQGSGGSVANLDWFQLRSATNAFVATKEIEQNDGEQGVVKIPGSATTAFTGIGSFSVGDWIKFERTNFGPHYDASYRTLAADEFNLITPEYSMKMKHTWLDRESPHDFTKADVVVDFAKSHGAKVHGHTLVWHASLPDWVPRLEEQNAWSTLREVMLTHINKVLQHYRNEDSVAVWDVVNEAIDWNGSAWAYRETPWKKAFENQPGGTSYTYIDEAFRAARAADPGVQLIYNDFHIEKYQAKRDLVLQLVSGMQSRGVPIDGVGLQLHVRPGDFTFDELSETIEAFAKKGLDVYITELDYLLIDDSTTKLVEQADVYWGIINRCIAEPRCVALQTWGFTDRYTWLDARNGTKTFPLPFDRNLNPKPAYYALQAQLEGWERLENKNRPETYLRARGDANLEVSEWENFHSQQWKIENLGSGWARLKNRNYGTYLRARGDGSVTMEPWQNLHSQQWKLDPVDDRWYRIENRLYTTYLRLQDSGEITVNPWNNYASQKWRDN